MEKRQSRDKYKKIKYDDHDPAEDSGKLEGRNAVLEAIKSGREINKIFVLKGESSGSIKQIIALSKQKGIVIVETDRAKLDSMSSSRAHQGVIAMVSPASYVDVDDILNKAQEKGEPPFIVILDEINDPNNLGSILRTADAVGAHGIIIPKRRSTALTPTVAKVAAGAIEYVPVARVPNLTRTIEYLKEKGLWIAGTDMSGEKSFYEADLKGAIALVIGNEGKGMGRLVSEKCDFIINIPMAGNIQSLNAGVAAGIVMYEIFRQRRQG